MTAHHCLDSSQVSNLNYRRIDCLIFSFSMLGESPPPAPRACFGRDELIEKIVGLAENLTPIALIGVGGIGKTSIALTVLHHDRVRQRFGDNRRFIRCDQFTTSCAHFLRRLSKAIGAGIENPEDLVSLRPFLASREVFIVLDNAESILDPQGMDAQEIYAVVEELSQLNKICLCITSRISTIPSDCKTLSIPTLSIEAARDAFYRIYENGERPGLIDNILNQLDFHPLSITLLATVAHHNKWDTSRLTKEWEQRRTSVLQTEHNTSFAATIELSLASAMFQELGPDARALLEVVAFFPQGVNENNLDWLFPTISNGTNAFDKFSILSLTYQSNGFITMLAPLRDHLSPKDPKSSSLLCAARERYFVRMSVKIDPNDLNFEETRWIASEDVNVEHLLDIFTTIDPNSNSVWDACANFIQHLFWHKKRPTILRPKIKGLSDDHKSKLECLSWLSWLLHSIGNYAECKQLLTHALKLHRERGNLQGVAQVLRDLSDTNWPMGLHKEGIQQAKEALDIFEQLGDTVEQADCLIGLTLLLCSDKQFDAAEETASHAIDLISDKGKKYQVCESHQILGNIYQSKGKADKAIQHYELALGIATSFNWHDRLFSVHHSLAWLFRNEGRFDDAHAHLGHAKSYTADSPYNLGLAMEEQALVWYEQHRLEEAKAGALRATDVFEGLWAAKDMDDCRKLLQDIQTELHGVATSGQSALNREPLSMVLFLARID
jgi:tetratricopeptide (TPR) repeat protein